MWAQSLGWEDAWRRKRKPIPVLLLGKFHGQRSLVGYSPRGCKDSDTTEHTCARTHTHTHTHILILQHNMTLY